MKFSRLLYISPMAACNVRSKYQCIEVQCEYTLEPGDKGFNDKIKTQWANLKKVNFQLPQQYHMIPPLLQWYPPLRMNQEFYNQVQDMLNAHLVSVRTDSHRKKERAELTFDWTSERTNVDAIDEQQLQQQQFEVDQYYRLVARTQKLLELIWRQYSESYVDNDVTLVTLDEHEAYELTTAAPIAGSAVNKGNTHGTVESDESFDQRMARLSAEQGQQVEMSSEEIAALLGVGVDELTVGSSEASGTITNDSTGTSNQYAKYLVPELTEEEENKIMSHHWQQNTNNPHEG